MLFEDAPMCSFCEPPLRDRGRDEREEREEDLAPIGVRGAGADTEVEPEWRREVARRMDLYRARRRRYLPEDDSQTPLPFHAETGVETRREPESVRIAIREDVEVRSARATSAAAYAATSAVAAAATSAAMTAAVAPALTPRRAAPARQPNRVEISVNQPELDFSMPDDRAHPETALIPVASLIDRRQAGALDLLFLGVSYAGFLGLFHSLGGHVSFAKVDAAVYGIVFFILATVYFSLFTVLGGATPGMQFRGLYVVRLDGSLPETRQLVWRSFGYVLSGGALMLGFLWSLWDEDRFTWHDRISQTYVTSAVPLGMGDSFGRGAGADGPGVGAGVGARQTFAHK